MGLPGLNLQSCEQVCQKLLAASCKHLAEPSGHRTSCLDAHHTERQFSQLAFLCIF